MTVDAELVRAELLARLVPYVAQPGERERIASSLMEASEHPDFEALDTLLAIGDRVELTSWPPEVIRTGWFVAHFDDDDEGLGNGPTYRILASEDDQVWEGPTVRRLGRYPFDGR